MVGSLYSLAKITLFPELTKFFFSLATIFSRKIRKIFGGRTRLRLAIHNLGNYLREFTRIYEKKSVKYLFTKFYVKFYGFYVIDLREFR